MAILLSLFHRLYFFVTVTFCVFVIINGSIYDKLTYHEVVSIHNTYLRNKRSTQDDMTEFTKEFNFNAFNRSFNCRLSPRLNLFTPNFSLTVYGNEGQPRELSFRRDQIYVGKCNGDPDSEIRGTFKEGIFSGTIIFDNQLYGVENAKFHIETSLDEEDSRMIIYRASDVIWQKGPKKSGINPGFCGDIHVNVLSESSSNITSNEKSSRKKRATATTLNTCKLAVVADYKFYRSIGRSNIYDTALYMASVIDRVDNIYRKTVFALDSQIDGLGFEIAKMIIHEVPTTGFNAKQDSWDPLTLLQYFSRNLEFKNYCAAHLFTHESFAGNVLGLAYIAPPRVGSVGGICSPVSTINNFPSSLNTGWSTTKNQNGDTVLLQQADLVTAHELGHNWGAEHDSETSDCSPSSKGKYLMYPYSVSGYDGNNFLFSPCSRVLMSKVLQIKRESCFSEKSFEANQVCGNGKIDEGEQCDAGLMGRFDLDPCCNSYCQFVNDASCSPANHECCLNCQMAPSGTTCRFNSEVDCLESAFCDGLGLSCPQPKFKQDNASCLDKGQCRSGKCIAFCEARYLFPCACEDLANSCKRCCRKDSQSPCVPFDDKSPLPNGRPCVGGYCQDNVCKSSKVSTIQRLFEIFENLSIDNIGKIFRTNIVGCVIVFSLVLWIPASTAIWCHDRKEMKKSQRQLEDIEIRTDRNLLHDEDGRLVAKPIRTSKTEMESLRLRNVTSTFLKKDI